MPEEKIDTDLTSDIPDALMSAPRSFSLVWLVPVIALLIGGWLIVKAVTEKGPTVTITFAAAEGIEAGKTKIKYKDVEVGLVKAIQLSEDSSHVVVTADMVKQAAHLLSENSKFWVVKARVTGGEVSGLGTLFSGAYIALDPGKGGQALRHFQGLEIPPVMTTDLPGRHFTLKAERLGSINYGSPVYYRQIKVGEVDGFSLDEAGETVEIQVFIQAPYHQFVRTNTRFWQSSGLDLELSAQGLRVDTQSLVSMMIGGIAFGPLEGVKLGAAAEEGATFRLSDTYSAAQKTRYTKTGRYLLYFDQSIRGLSVGAPVEFRGIQLGEVTDIRLETGQDLNESKILVTIEIEAERFGLSLRSPEERQKSLSSLVDKGLRAQLEFSSLLTGQLFVELDYHPDASPRVVDLKDEYPVIPTVPTDLEGIMTNVSGFIARLDKLPVEEIGSNINQVLKGVDALVNSPDLKKAVQNLGEALQAFKETAGTLNESTLPGLDSALGEIEASFHEIQTMVDADAPLQYDLHRALTELSAAAKSIRNMADQIEQHPESLIRGK